MTFKIISIGSFYTNAKGQLKLIAGEIDITNPLYARGYRFFDQDLIYYTAAGRHQSIWRRYDLTHAVNNKDVSIDESGVILRKANQAVEKKIKRERGKLIGRRICTAIYLGQLSLIAGAAVVENQRRKKALALAGL